MGEENIAETYLDGLKDETNPGALLARFYAELYSQPYNPQLIILINRLIKVYGRETTFYSILSIENMKDLDHSNIYPLLRYMCNKRLESKSKPTNELVDLTGYIQTVKIKSEKVRAKKMKVSDPFEN